MYCLDNVFPKKTERKKKKKSIYRNPKEEVHDRR